jgi:signal transduction histidine kinase
VIIPPIPLNESERLSELYRYNILDTPAEGDFDEIVQLASSLANCPISLITLIDKDRQWFKAKLGMEISETEREVAFCAHCILQNEPLIIEDASKDERFSQNPFVSISEGIRFYAGFPLMTPAGVNLGSLCVVDTKPVKLSESQINALKILARQVVKQMELRLRNDELKRLTEVNNTIISVISHDYRSPLASVKSLLNLIDNSEINAEDLKEWIPQIKESLERALELSSDLIKWSIARIKNKSVRMEDISLSGLVQDVIENDIALFLSKKNKIKIDIPKQLIVFGDKDYLKVIFRNLILNANKFTASGTIVIKSEKAGNFIKCTVSDNGIGMSSAKLKELFSFTAVKAGIGTSGERGSGIGLILCKDLIESMGGKINVESQENQGTLVHFSIPDTTSL